MRRTLSILLAGVLFLTGCGAVQALHSDKGAGAPTPGRDTQSTAGSQVLAQPVYPEFPKQPVMPLEGSAESWEAYTEAYSKYTDALRAVRGDAPSLTEEEQSVLNTFAARSIPLVLAGHEGKSAVYSPLSLWSALTLLAQCAGGDSRQQVLDVLGTDSTDILQEQASHIWRALYTDDGLSALILSNSVWLNSAMEGLYVQDTLDILAENYFAGAYSIPMGTESADRAVTNWVKARTNGLIGGDASVIQTSEDILTLLVSSLYYKAAWTNEFSAARTETDTFTGATGQERQVEFMHQSQYGAFLRRESWQAARLQTQLGEVVFVLPDEGVSPESLFQASDFLSELNFSSEHSTWGEIRWSVPKFDVTSELGLLDALKGLGITDLLDQEKADLSALTSLEAYVADAKQLVRVKVDEEGVEAAAVTNFVDVVTSMPAPAPEVCVMDLDRPFLFIIRTYQDVPLFVGVVNQV